MSTCPASVRRLPGVLSTAAINFPAEHQGSYFYGDYVNNWIRRLTFDENSNVMSDFPFWPDDGSFDGPWGDIVDMAEGPDGALYYTDVDISVEGEFRQGTIRRISFVPSGSNQPPTITLALTNNGDASFEFASNETGSTFQCRLDNAGFAPCTSPQIYLGLAAGNHIFQVAAIDAAGDI